MVRTLRYENGFQHDEPFISCMASNFVEERMRKLSIIASMSSNRSTLGQTLVPQSYSLLSNHHWEFKLLISCYLCLVVSSVLIKVAWTFWINKTKMWCEWMVADTCSISRWETLWMSLVNIQEVLLLLLLHPLYSTWIITWTSGWLRMIYHSWSKGPLIITTWPS